MKLEKIDKHLQAICTLAKQVDMQPEAFIITGSLALYIQGLTEDVPEDVDLVMNYISINAAEKLQGLSQLFPIYPNIPEETKSYWEVEYQFILCGVKYDIFYAPAVEMTFMWSGFRINAAGNVIKAKKRMNRLKDLKALAKMAASLINY